MQQIFSFQGAGEIYFGCGAINQLPDLSVRYGSGRILLVMDPFLSQTPLKDRLVEDLKSKGVVSVLFDQIEPEPSPSSAEAGAGLARKKGCFLVIGVGGGSTLDTAKAVAMLTLNKGKVGDYVGLDRVPKPGLPTVLIPTTAGTGSEVTFTAVFTNRATKTKGGISSRFLYPDVALLDPELTLSLPPQVTAQTGMDALTHAIEAYTSNKANPMSDMAAEKAITLIGQFLKRAVKNGKDLEAREGMLLGSLLAGMALTNAGVGAVHAMAYPLGTLFNIPHGLANAVLLPYVLEFNRISWPERFARMNQLLSGSTPLISANQGAQRCIKRISSLSQTIGIPRDLKELGIPQKAIRTMAEGVIKVARPIENNPRPITLKDIVALYRKVF
ncbi:MAG: iron-containing alcohol dehydrogenase [Deltaproteobacteria bacterium]|nr:iron-containing alcohol dehydrogenase [Deltaproteobacteria bacterium]